MAVASLRQRIADWIYRPRVPEIPPVRLVQRRIFIIPTRQGFTFALVLLVLLIASINYSLALGFLLTFLLAGIGGAATLHTFRNLAHLSISPGKVDAVFAGETAHFGLVLSNTALPRYAVGVTARGGAFQFADVPQSASTTLHIPIHAAKRGHLKSGRLEIYTEYPVGLFHAWSYVNFDSACLVYPKPDAGAGALPLDAHAKGEGNVPIPGDEEFQSLRPYKPGDTPRQIAWKALAREQGLLVKEFGSTASTDLWLDFSQLPGLGMEEKLSRLAWWVIEADRKQIRYGLRLPGTEIVPHLGEQHRLQCMEALALFGLSEEPAA